MPTSVLNQTTLTHDIQLSDSKNVSVANASSNTNYISGIAVVEQMPVKVSGAESKKGKVS
jgi:hypothetical protein